ncbi:hypothetical protein BC332_15482 [Capsicum chinense]|nr:hypothetical protein BC332_15482 [Capsicum chinense]
MPDRVMRQFDLPQHIPQAPEWNPENYDIDLRTRVDKSLVDLLGGYFNNWRDRDRNLARTVHDTVLRYYELWVLRRGRLLVGNPLVKAEVEGEDMVVQGDDPIMQLYMNYLMIHHHILLVPSEAILDMAGPYSMRPMELPFRPIDGPRRDVEAVHLSYRSAIDDVYMLDTPGPSSTQNIGQTFTQHTNEIFDMSMSGRSFELFMGYAMLTLSGFHIETHLNLTL